MKIAIVTGASRGIGREIAKVLSNQGIKVIANYNKSEEQAKILQKENPQIDIFKADVSNRAEVKRMVEYTLKKYEKIDILINNAGISEWRMFTETTDEDWDRMMNNNLYSTFCMTQEVLTNMIHNKKGNIINISSIWGMVGASLEVAYSTTKAAIIGMSKALAKELAPSTKKSAPLDIKIKPIASINIVNNIFYPLFIKFSL